MTTITTKTSKKGLVDFISEVAPQLKGKEFKDLADSVKYTMHKFAEDSTKVLKEDLFILASDIQAKLTLASAPVENSLKVKQVEVVEAPVTVVPPVNEEEQPTEKEVAEKIVAITSKKDDKKGKTTLKAKGKTEEKKDQKPSAQKPLVTPKENASTKQLLLAKQFPEEFTAEGVGKLKVITDEIKSMKDLYNLVQAKKDIVFAMYWTKRHFAQFEYDQYGINPKKAFKEMPNDLDLAQLVFVSEEFKVAYVVSAYSEVVYSILPSDLEMSDGMRYNNGIEFNIYENLE